MGQYDYLTDGSAAYDPNLNTQAQSGSWQGTPYRLPGVPGATPAPTTLPPIQQQQPQAPGFNQYASSMGLPAQQNFDGISHAIMAQQSPYVSFGANGWLQNNHPQVAHGLDNAFLAAANTQQGRTIGENISNVARGVIGGRQEMYQHNVQQALLPVELAQRQFAYQKNYLDVMKDRAQIDEASNNAYMNKMRGDNYARLSNSQTSPYSQVKVGTDGLMYGLRKSDGKMEAVPGQSSDDMTGDPGGPPKFPVPGTNRATTTNDLYARAAQGDKNAQATLRTKVSTESQIQGAKTAAIVNANTPKDVLQSESKGALDSVGPAPKNSTAEYQSYLSKQVMAQVPIDKIPDESTWAKGQMDAYNQRKTSAQQDVSDYTKSKAWQQGVSLNDWKAQRSQTKQTPGAAKQAAPARVPGASTPSAQPSAPDPSDPLRIFQR